MKIKMLRNILRNKKTNRYLLAGYEKIIFNKRVLCFN